jgi:hypothetical protein
MSTTDVISLNTEVSGFCSRNRASNNDPHPRLVDAPARELGVSLGRPRVRVSCQLLKHGAGDSRARGRHGQIGVPMVNT